MSTATKSRKPKNIKKRISAPPSLDECIPLVDVPEGTRGFWIVRKFKIPKSGAESFNKIKHIAEMGRQVVPGTYTKLTRLGDVIMSDTHAERKDHLDFVKAARGNVLVTGLGLGMVANAVLLGNARTCTVIERDKDVIDLVAGHYEKKFGDRFKVINADALKWVPEDGVKFDWAWHDIWPTIDEDNLAEMAEIEARLKPFVKKQAHWCKRECEKLSRQPSKYGLFFV